MSIPESACRQLTIICATPNAYTELLWSVESAMGDDEAVRLQPTTVTQSVSGSTIRR
ncbi:MAG: hypothetical protein ACLT4C_04455 [Butyricicoccus sp.]